MSSYLLPRSEVERRVGLKRSAIYDRIGKGTFPKPVHFIGNRTVRWREADVEKWKEDQLVG